MTSLVWLFPLANDFRPSPAKLSAKFGNMRDFFKRGLSLGGWALHADETPSACFLAYCGISCVVHPACAAAVSPMYICRTAESREESRTSHYTGERAGAGARSVFSLRSTPSFPSSFLALHVWIVALSTLPRALSLLRTLDLQVL